MAELSASVMSLSDVTYLESNSISLNLPKRLALSLHWECVRVVRCVVHVGGARVGVV